MNTVITLINFTINAQSQSDNLLSTLSSKMIVAFWLLALVTVSTALGKIHTFFERLINLTIHFSECTQIPEPIIAGEFVTIPAGANDTVQIPPNFSCTYNVSYWFLLSCSVVSKFSISLPKF